MPEVTEENGYWKLSFIMCFFKDNSPHDALQTLLSHRMKGDKSLGWLKFPSPHLPKPGKGEGTLGQPNCNTDQTLWELLFFIKHAHRAVNGCVLLRKNLSIYLFKVRFVSN